jgi:hypothetical protein
MPSELDPAASRRALPDEPDLEDDEDDNGIEDDFDFDDDEDEGDEEEEEEEETWQVGTAGEKIPHFQALQ